MKPFLYCCWCNRRFHIVIGSPPFILCNACYEELDKFDQLMVKCWGSGVKP